MTPGEASRIKRTMAEIKLGKLGVITSWWKGGAQGHMERSSRNSVYKQLRDRGYTYSPRYQIWIHESDTRHDIQKEKVIQTL